LMAALDPAGLVRHVGARRLGRACSDFGSVSSHRSRSSSTCTTNRKYRTLPSWQQMEQRKDGDYYMHLTLAEKALLPRCYTKQIPPQGADTRYVFLIYLSFLSIRSANSSMLMKG
jgi:hypothetical protein